MYILLLPSLLLLFITLGPLGPDRAHHELGPAGLHVAGSEADARRSSYYYYYYVLLLLLHTSSK